MADIKSAILIKKTEDGKEIWCYPITSTDNILHGSGTNEEQLDEIINDIRSKLSDKFDIVVGSTVPQSVTVDTYFMKIEAEE